MQISTYLQFNNRHHTDVRLLPFFSVKLPILIYILGWRSRKQFEESWMSLLGVFSLSKEDLSDAEVAALAQASTIAVSAITGLLLQTLVLPSPGQSNLSEAIHHPRLAPSYNH